MTRAWQTLAREATPDGALELRRRGPGDFLITLDGRVLMNSRASRSEEALALRAAEALAGRTAPRVVIGGLGMGCTLRAALDALPPATEITVSELHATVAAWVRGPLAEVSRNALADPRVTLHVGDVADFIRALAGGAAGSPVDAIVLDLFAGPHRDDDPVAHPVYGARALRHAHRALTVGGVLAIWSEDPDPGFEARLAHEGFGSIALHRPGRGGRRHAVYVATATSRPLRRSP